MFDTVGDVKVALDAQVAQSATKGSLLKNGMNVITGDKSTAVLKFDDGEVIALAENTSFKIEDYRFVPKEIEKSNMFFSVLRGGLRAITGLIGKRPEAFKLKTPGTTIGIRGTDFVWVFRDGKTYLQVLKGGIAVNTSGGTLVVAAGQTCLVAGAGAAPVLAAASEIPASVATTLNALGTMPAVGAAVGGGAGSAGAGASAGAIGGLGTGAEVGIGVGVAVVGAAVADVNKGAGSGTTGTVP